jgi:hypothetical protein
MTEYGYPHLKLCVYCSVELAAGVVDNIRALEG